MPKKYFFFLILWVSPTIIKSQDSLGSTLTEKRGIYFTWKEFYASTPSLKVSFTMEPHSFIISSYLDSFQYTYYCKLTDTSIHLEKVFSVFDGSNLYLKVLMINDTFLFSKMKYAGKYPFVMYNSKTSVSGGKSITNRRISA